MAQAAAYPVAMKLVAGWFRRDRGLAIGVVIGALTVGTALPFLFRAIGACAGVDWRRRSSRRQRRLLSSGRCSLAFGARTGPFDVAVAAVLACDRRRAFREPAVRLANLGYLGHMWELFAMWTWVPLFFVASFAAAGVNDPALASLAAFVVVGGGRDRLRRSPARSPIGSGGRRRRSRRWPSSGTSRGRRRAPVRRARADRRRWSASSGASSVVADSAQFSAAVSELAPPGTAGSALSVQTAVGFTLTSITILVIGLLDPTDADGWRVACDLLALGPVVGIVAMWRLRARPDATHMASGHR